VTRTAAEVRREFIEFFCQKHGHKFVPSSPVVPHDDPTLLFTNAGMNQFKPYFLGTETPKNLRVANTQKCIRAGGKHNDLDDVGHDTYHHTFFEMLGNWSFGDYFKQEAIGWAWELLVDVWGLDPTRLHATYFGGDAAEGLEPDVEARDLWLRILPAERVHAGSKKDNFWEMGETGPCGPCSEVHVDLTPDKSGAALVNAGDARVIEIWNLVFIQFNRAADSKLTPLPAKHVDTGMGFERVTAVLQGHNNNYATDVFVPIIQAIEKISGHIYGSAANPPVVPPTRGDGPTNPPPSQGGVGGGSNRYAVMRPGNMQDEACRVIADHIRTLTFAITDGAVPDKEGRGYVLRRILRRAVRFGWQHLNLHEPFLCKLVDTVVATMGDAFPELKKNPQHVRDVLREEEESFDRALGRGIEMFNESVLTAIGHAIERAQGWTLTASATWLRATSGAHWTFDTPAGRRRVKESEARALVEGSITFPGDVAFRLHDTYGFPVDLTQIMASEKGLTVDIGEYERLMEEARERARAARAFVPFEHPDLEIDFRALGPTVFAGYEGTEIDDAVLLGMFVRGGNVIDPRPIASISEGDEAALVLDKTPFYSEKGGQVGDRGVIESSSFRFVVEDTQEVGETVLHLGTCVSGQITGYGLSLDELTADERRESACHAVVGATCRRATMKNHTATHVLNWALREVLGDHVQQKGSLVDHEKTRFDFSHPRALTPEEIERVEQLANDKIRQNLPVSYETVPQKDALKINGLRAVFGERYPDEVRVLSVGANVADLLKQPDNPKWRECSIEFCGGTHVKNTGEIERFVLINEEAVAKGVRRLVGLTSAAATAAEEAGAALVKGAEELKRGPPEEVPAGLVELQNSLAAAVIPLRQRHHLRALSDELQQIVKSRQKSAAADAAEIVRQKVAELLQSAPKIGNTTVIVAEMPDVPAEQLKHGADLIKQKCGSAAILFGVRSDEKAALLAAMTDDLVKMGVKAGDLVKAIAPIVGGGGGGPPTMAQAGGRDPGKLPEALEAGRKWIGGKLGD
jgi:alanyl-tRNA synthetase